MAGNQITKTIYLNTFRKKEVTDYFDSIAQFKDGIHCGDFGKVMVHDETMVCLPLGKTTQVRIDFYLKEKFADDFLHRFRINFSRGGA